MKIKDRDRRAKGKRNLRELAHELASRSSTSQANENEDFDTNSTDPRYSQSPTRNKN